jgi:glucuronate isomerase
MPFIHPDFLLETDTARRLFHTFAERQPVIDYHCHLPPADIASNRRFANLFEVWLEGDHYKWRAMRANGVDERFCTGDASPYEKFQAWAATVPHCVRNPLYHWTHLELVRYFGMWDLLDGSSAAQIWASANDKLASDELSVHGILNRFGVRVICTTDDPADDLSHHQTIAASSLSTRVYPTFRPDRALDVHQPAVFNAWLDRLGQVADVDVQTYRQFLAVLSRRHQAFHDVGGRLSDHGLDTCYADPIADGTAAAIFERVRSGRAATSEERAGFASNLMLFFGRLDAEKGWTKQLHLGARRNANSRALARYGRDGGYDSVGDWPQIDALGTYLDLLDREDCLPKTIVYNLNPADNYAFATMIGNFQDGRVAGKMQWGSGWWFLDQKEGMEWQINALSNAGLLSRFVGMTTDSRSFLSYPRHEYFRRTLCNLVGRDVERGEIPDDEELLRPLIEGICYRNAREYFGLQL